MAGTDRLVTVVDLDERDQRGQSVWAHLYVELVSGERHLLLDDRGWSGSGPVTHGGVREIENTARTVVGPDEPRPDETQEQMEAGYWEWMERKLQDSGISAVAAELKALPHDVEIGEHLRRLLAVSS